MNPTSSTPSFPLEIFNLIIEELVENPDYLPDNLDAFNSVKQCAMVCRSFAALCQPYVFRVTKILPQYYHLDKRVDNFIQIMQSNPNLSRYVRYLSVYSTERIRMPIKSSDRISQVIQVLKGFPNLIKLEIRNNADMRIMRTHPQHFYDSLRGLINTYAAQGTLHSLSICGLDDLPVVDIFSCSTITQFRLYSLTIPSFTISAPHITLFEVQDTNELDLSVLCSFPKLQKLSVGAVFYMVPRYGNTAPSFDLRVLTMSMNARGAVTTLLDFYNRHAERKDVKKPFGKLEKLRYNLPFQEDVEAVEIMLQETTSLKALKLDNLQGSSLQTKTYPLARLHLSNKILNVFPHLTKLSFKLHVDNSDDYNEMMTEIANIIGDIEGKNIIEDVNVSISAEACIFDSIPSSGPWSRISRSLSSCNGYPRLKVVSTLLLIRPSTDLQWLSSVDENYMPHAMKEMVERKGVDFQGKMDINEFLVDDSETEE